MAPLDLVLLLLISNAVQNAMTGPDTRCWAAIVSASHPADRQQPDFSRLRLAGAWRCAGAIGEPTDLIRDGEILSNNT